MIDVQQDIQNRIERTEKLLERLHKALDDAKEGNYLFRMVIQSAWSDYGEKEGVGMGQDPETAEQKAIENFKEVNGRNEVQASNRTMYVILPDMTIAPHGFIHS